MAKPKPKPGRYFCPKDNGVKKTDTEENKMLARFPTKFKRGKFDKKHALLRKGFMKTSLNQKVSNRKKRRGVPDKPVPRELLKKYKRADRLSEDGVKTKYHKSKYKEQQRHTVAAATNAARLETLTQAQPGYIEADEGEDVSLFSQHEIAANVDISSAKKLDLHDFGPYQFRYSRSGRQLVLAGARGHLAELDWQTKKLMCEVNVMESTSDVTFLHNETMFAVAQKKWTYIYDNQGIELHCLKTIDRAVSLDFLPYHMLLVAGSSTSYLQWLDVSMGKKVAGFPTAMGPLNVLGHNHRNATVHTGHPGGSVAIWSPNVREPLAKLLCHHSTVRDVCVDHTGWYMATSGVDRSLKLWDLRTYRAVHSCTLGASAGHLGFSQTGLLACATGRVVQCIRFCPFEDVLGVGHGKGFSSILVPGAGEANYDALESNPYQTKRQRREAEVKLLLEKVQPELITLDTDTLSVIDKKTLEDKMAEKAKLMSYKPEEVEFQPKYRKKGRSKSGKIEKRKQGVKFEEKQKQIKEHALHMQNRGKEAGGPKTKTNTSSGSVLDRFRKQ